MAHPGASNHQLLVAGRSNTMLLLNTFQGKLIQAFPAYGCSSINNTGAVGVPCMTMKRMPALGLLACGLSTGTIVLRDPRQRECAVTRVMQSHGAALSAMAVVRDHVIVTCGLNNK